MKKKTQGSTSARVHDRGDERGWHRLVWFAHVAWYWLLTRSLATAIARARLMSITLGRDIYLSPMVDESTPWGQSVIVHELVHVRQWRRWGLLYPLLYLLWPLPVGVTMRAAFEAEAYLLQARWLRSNGHNRLAEQLEERLPRIFTGPDYGWMDWRGWQLRRARSRQRAGQAKSSRDRRPTP